jgi:hypothetical protein
MKPNYIIRQGNGNFYKSVTKEQKHEAITKVTYYLYVHMF